MGSDRARVTYDPEQQFRSVVMQQGRVTLEADWNEAAQIASEELRHETLDIVGPCGTPDDGYEVLLTPTSPPYDFSIGSGTMYVGGVRAYLFAPVPYSNQPDWRDYGPDDPDWVDLASFAGSPASSPIDEFVYLYLREQEVSAVEDQDLKDVALGGPDTAQRTRLLQRFVRVESSGADCTSGLAAAQAKWETEGLTFDPATMRLNPWSRLQASFSNQGQQPDPCQPQAQGGYLDPDNQLIRVQISGVDQASGNPKFLWGFDNASFLYRINVDPNNPQNLIFQSVPVDASHQPVSKQAVEVLRTAADLPNGGMVASASGFVLKLDQNYNPDSQSIVLPAGVTLPSSYTNPNQSPPSQLFLRVWQQELVFTPGTPIALGDTGVLVTLSLASGNVFHEGDYWLFAVRPGTPQSVYPEHYQNAPQPPEGPRLWACPLGVIAWTASQGPSVTDCRNQFNNLVDLSKRWQGCCSITVSPKDLLKTPLQSVIYQASRPTMVVQAANAGKPGNNITVEVSNLRLDLTPPTFDLTVTETDVYLGLTMAGARNGIELVLGDEEGGPNDGLAHVLTGSTNVKLVPLTNQTVTFSGGAAGASAQANFMDTTNQQTVFTLQARNPGSDGNVTQAAVFNVSGSSFDLTITWEKTLFGLDMSTLFPRVQSNLGYLIMASPPTTVAPALPAEGVTQLSGGAEATSSNTNAATAQAGIFGSPVKICLRPGSYLLSKPLVFGPEQSNITLEACGAATLSAVVEEQSKDFALGMMLLNGANNVTLRGLTFAMPRVIFYESGFGLANTSPATLNSIGDSVLAAIDTSVGLMVSGTSGLTVENCCFRFPRLELEELMFAAAVFAGADCNAVTLKGNLFEGPTAINTLRLSGATVPSFALASGYVQADSLQSLTLGAGGAGVTGGTLVPSSLDNLVVQENSFENLAFPVFITTALGAANFEDNVVRSCLSGFTLFPLFASVASVNQLAGSQAAAGDARAQLLQNAAAQRMATIALAYPRPSSFTPTRQIVLETAVKTSPPAPWPAPPKLLRTSTSVTHIVLPAAVVAAAPAPDTPAAPAPAVPAVPGAAAAPAAPAAPNPTVAPVLKLQNLQPFTARLAEFASNVPISIVWTLGGQRKLDFSLRISNNDIEALVAGGVSLWALTIADVADILTGLGGSPPPNLETTFGVLTMTGNKLINAFNASSDSIIFTASLMVRYCSVTGSVIWNQAQEGYSLAVVVFDAKGNNIALGAITGNVLIGTTVLPARNPASLPAWSTYNYST